MRTIFIKFLLLILCLKSLTGSNCYAAIKQDKRYAAVVIDDKTGKILYKKYANALRHPASLTKKMTLYLIFEDLRAQKITLKTRFATSTFATQQMPCKLGLNPGNTIDVATIIKSLITKSANDVAVVVAEGLAGSHGAFIQRMNITAKKLGMRNTRFYNASGVPDRRQVTTAMDMAILARALLHQYPEYYAYFQLKSFCYQGKYHNNHNHMLDSFPGLDGIKTGFTNASGFNISTSALRYDEYNRPHRLFAVVMGGSSWRERDRKAALLLQREFEKIGAIYIKKLTPSTKLKHNNSPLSYINYQPQLEKILSQNQPKFTGRRITKINNLDKSLVPAPKKKSKRKKNNKTSFKGNLGTRGKKKNLVGLRFKVKPKKDPFPATKGRTKAVRPKSSVGRQKKIKYRSL